MRTVMGLSKTSTSIGWVLLDGDDVSGDPLDHDAFDVTNASAVTPAATARRVREIATATGYSVDCVHVTTSGNMSSLRDALTEAGFDEVVSVPLTQATRAWAMDAGRADGQAKTAVCLLGRDSASLSVVDTHSGATEAMTTIQSRDSASLIDWLNTAIGRNGSQPEALYLIGSRAELKVIAGPLAAALPIPVDATRYAQLALARGAAYSAVNCLEGPVVDSRPGLASAAKTLGVIAAVAAASLVTLSAASAPIRLAESNSHSSESPPTPNAAEMPPDTASVAPLVFPPPPAPEDAVPASTPEPAEQPAQAYAVAPETDASPAHESATVAPPPDHLPDVAPMQHIPDAQPGDIPGPGPAAPAAATPPPADSMLPLPQDPSQQAMSPLFSGLP